jgi:hypothetical protein
MLVMVPTVYEDVIEVNHKKFANERFKGLVHHTHESTWCVGETKWHYKPFKQPISRLEGGLPLVSESDSNLVVTTAEVYFGEDLGTMQLI